MATLLLTTPAQRLPPSATAPFVAAHTFSVVYEDAGDGWVYAHVPELPEVHTQGENLDQAREMVKDAIALVLDERRARSGAIPPTVPRHREIKMPTARGSAARSASLPHRAPDSQTPVRKRVPKYVPNSAILTRPNLS